MGSLNSIISNQIKMMMENKSLILTLLLSFCFCSTETHRTGETDEIDRNDGIDEDDEDDLSTFLLPIFNFLYPSFWEEKYNMSRTKAIGVIVLISLLSVICIFCCIGYCFIAAVKMLICGIFKI